MGGEGHMLDMIRRLSEGREASRLRRERNNEKLKRFYKISFPHRVTQCLSLNPLFTVRLKGSVLLCGE